VPSIEQVPHILKLLDDSSPVVREELCKALSPLAPELGEALNRFEATPDQRASVRELLADWRRQRLLEGWRRWQNFTDSDTQQLEMAHRVLNEFECGWLYPTGLAQELDRLAREFTTPPTPSALAEFLFAHRLRGAREDYNLPTSSFLRHVLANRRGNPISLCSIFILVGARVGMPIWGVNFPGHFLARCPQAGEMLVFDCYQAGRQLPTDLEPTLRGDLSADQARGLVETPVSSHQIVQRVLNNLVKSYIAQERRADANLFHFLGKDMAARERGLPGEHPVREPQFQPGQLVRHRRKNYRGVVVDYHLWTAQRLEQPSYRVLVHGSPTVATANEDDLENDRSGGLVAHPFVGYFFSRFENGVYLRNSFPWES
jgi:hemimethylated DNA binding protein